MLYLRDEFLSTATMCRVAAQQPHSCWQLHVVGQSMGATEAHRSHLDQGVVSTAQHGLCLAQRINLTNASRLASIVVFQEPVALLMETSNVLCCLHCFNVLRVLCVGVGLQLSL